MTKIRHRRSVQRPGRRVPAVALVFVGEVLWLVAPDLASARSVPRLEAASDTAAAESGAAAERGASADSAAVASEAATSEVPAPWFDWSGVELGTTDGLALQSYRQLAAGHRDSAIATLTALLRLDPGDPRPYRGLIEVLHAAGDDARAYRLFEAAKQGLPGSILPLLALGTVEIDRGRPEYAEHHFQQAIGLAPETPEALAGYARALAATGAEERLAGYLEKLLQSNPRSSAYHYGKAVAASLFGDMKTAKTHYRWAIQLDPRNWNAELDYGRELAELGETELARNHLQRAADILLDMRDPLMASVARREFLALDTADENAAEP